MAAASTSGSPRATRGARTAKTLTLNIRKGVKWTDGKPLTAADVVYSLTAGKQDPTMDILGTTREGTNIAAVQQKGAVQGPDQAEDA